MMNGAGNRNMQEVVVKNYDICPRKDERAALEGLIGKGKHPAVMILNFLGGVIAGIRRRRQSHKCR
jgi:hypothetical protein